MVLSALTPRGLPTCMFTTHWKSSCASPQFQGSPQGPILSRCPRIHSLWQEMVHRSDPPLLQEGCSEEREWGKRHPRVFFGPLKSPLVDFFHSLWADDSAGGSVAQTFCEQCYFLDETDCEFLGQVEVPSGPLMWLSHPVREGTDRSRFRSLLPATLVVGYGHSNLPWCPNLAAGIPSRVQGDGEEGKFKQHLRQKRPCIVLEPLPERQKPFPVAEFNWIRPF